MSFLVDTSHRSSATEMMDDFSLKGVDFRDTLDKLEIINRLLGGNSVTIKGLKKLLDTQLIMKFRIEKDTMGSSRNFKFF